MVQVPVTVRAAFMNLSDMYMVDIDESIDQFRNAMIREMQTTPAIFDQTMRLQFGSRVLRSGEWATLRSIGVDSGAVIDVVLGGDVGLNQFSSRSRNPFEFNANTAYDTADFLNTFNNIMQQAGQTNYSAPTPPAPLTSSNSFDSFNNTLQAQVNAPKTIIVRTFDGITKKVDTQLTDTVGAFKQRVAAVFGAHPSSQRLYHLGIEMTSDQQILQLYGVYAGATVHLVIQPMPFKVYIRTPDGRTERAEADPSETVAAFKTKVAPIVRLPALRMNLLFSGKRLEDQTTMGSHGMAAGATLNLVDLTVTLIVQTPSGRNSQVEIALNKTVLQLKQHLQSLWGMLPEQQSITLAGETLSDSATLEFCGVVHGSTLLVTEILTLSVLYMPSRRTVSVPCPASASVRYLKALLAQEVRLPVEKQQLSLNNQPLSDEMSLAQSGIVSNSANLKLVTGMTIFVSVPSGGTLALTVPADATVESLKQTLAEKVGVPVHEQRLACAGIGLHDGTLGSNGVRDGSDLQMRRRTLVPTLDDLRANPDFNKAKSKVQANSSTLHGVVDALVRQNLAMRDLIQGNQEQFVTMLTEPVELPRSNNEPWHARVNVYMLPSKRVAITADLNDSVLAFKIQVQAALGVTKANQQLCFGTHMLDQDDVTLASYGVKAAAMIQCIEVPAKTPIEDVLAQNLSNYFQPKQQPPKQQPVRKTESSPKAQEETQEPERTAKTLDELLELIQTGRRKEWPLLGNYFLCPDVIASSNHSIFRVLNKRQPLKQLAVKLSDCRREMDFFESINGIENANEHIVECVEWGELTLANYKCYATIMERGLNNCSDRRRFLRRDKFARYRCIEHVAHALRFLHSQRWIHGDIKLENVVYFGDEAGYKLIDLDHAIHIQTAMSAHCTHEYCPPEMASFILGHTRALAASEKFDIWCLGVLVLKLFVEGDVLHEFEGLSDDGILQLIASPDFALVESLDECSLELSQKRRLARCLHPDPARRGTLDDILAILPRTTTMRTAHPRVQQPSASHFRPPEPPAAKPQAPPAIPKPQVTPSSNQVKDVPLPCMWKLEGASDPLPRGDKLRSLSLRIVFSCEMRDGTPCEFDVDAQDTNLCLEAQSPALRLALSSLKTSFLVHKAMGLVTSYGISNGPHFNFEFRDGPLVQKVLVGLENIHGAVESTAPAGLEEFVEALDNGDLDDDEVSAKVPKLFAQIEEYRVNDATQLIKVLESLGFNYQRDVVGGLTKRVVKRGSSFEGQVRWVCKKHAQQFGSSFC
ncbi:hypothetical protein Ae201684P_021477 [Aphanomyces euteiches]|uniref:Protein kinase domain-containing protein n=1 Tax=Aphanomyces euteiches TaxID=100861 RepID=A0A6G0X7A2_9STRA|nr:hypothetical protein Ae201684_007901 [Aphanomyces euteiches]KAH9067317.1 hypothetical protein Ae201684P_021477 [Aphanomyces euteiches]